jgi:hypothetical protein
MTREQFGRLAMLLLAVDGALSVPATAPRWDVAQWRAVEGLLLHVGSRLLLLSPAGLTTAGHVLKRGALPVAFREEFHPRHRFAPLYLVGVQSRPLARPKATRRKPAPRQRRQAKRGRP